MTDLVPRIRALAVVLLVVIAGCSAGELSGDATTPDDTPATGDEILTGMDPDFDVDSLPGDFPANLVPDSFSGGLYVELGTVRNVNFESEMSFDDAVDEYTAKIGQDPILVQGEERLAQWTVDIWSVSVLESTPTLIAITTAE